MSMDTKQQIYRHISHEALINGDFAPMDAHPGMRETIATLRDSVVMATDRTLSFSLQFGQGDWLASIQHLSSVPTAPRFGTDMVGKRMAYEVVQFCLFEGDTIVKQHAQADGSSIMAQIAGKPATQHTYRQTGEASLSPEAACTLVRRLVEAGMVRHDFSAYDEHPAFQANIPAIEWRRSKQSQLNLEFPLQFSDGEWVALRGVCHQTAKGEMFGVDATGKQLEFEVLMVCRIEDGRAVTLREFPDLLAMRQQLGIEV